MPSGRAPGAPHAHPQPPERMSACEPREEPGPQARGLSCQSQSTCHGPAQNWLLVLRTTSQLTSVSAVYMGGMGNHGSVHHPRSPQPGSN